MSNPFPMDTPASIDRSPISTDASEVCGEDTWITQWCNGFLWAPFRVNDSAGHGADPTEEPGLER